MSNTNTVLQFVADAWIVNFWPDSWKDRDTVSAVLRRCLSALPALEVVSIVTDHFQCDSEPDIGLLPDVRDPGFNCTRLKTVRLVHGYNHLLKPREARQLSLSRVLNQFELGSFDYLNRLILSIALRFTLDDAELARLRTYVPHVDVEYSDECPDMPHVEYATDPEVNRVWEDTFY
ncbi:hypothetical protein L226DRAFT_469509 [Lentinus tigrinus ALCF2SS1-7]|uniref:Uncharacterized protein n=1 Tax=Lentinus tigrinus ALCF2SS1-6 TaxID=1328759 RepID=A0A5C2S6B7_9APHY|nr:hypothetical protein L227DRAFT_503418 [Lentinus tigrinus ALCF2SS1-6]RPD70753.1 hypothetical protein L226DRAFT_469509 [Lentinus tigrinus ALCF2SS1-7]